MDIYGINLVNMIATKPLCFLIKLGRHVHHVKRMDPIDFAGQRSRSQWTFVGITL